MTTNRKTTASSRAALTGTAETLIETDAEGGWAMARPRTLVDHAVDAIIAAAARGLILPGDRLSEPDLAARLGMSRVPIREALRLLESQGIVTSEPYKGIRLMEVTEARLRDIIDVRAALEALAVSRAIEKGMNGPAIVAGLDAAIAEMERMRQDGDVYGFARTDALFHRRLVAAAGNPVLSMQWESLSRQLTVLFGLSTQGKQMTTIVEEHRALADVFAAGDIDTIRGELEEHIRVQALDVGYEQIIAERRRARIPG